MPLDAMRVAEVREWLVKAAHDLRASQTLLSGDSSLPDVAVFHCQQASEKVLKAFLSWHDRPFRKTHNLEELGEQCLEIDPTMRTLIDRLVPLTEYAWRFRYPGDPGMPTREEAEEAHGVAEDAYAGVTARLPAETRP